MRYLPATATYLLLSCLFSTMVFAQNLETDPDPEAYEMLAQVYELRANNGDAQAAYDLGFLYNSGLGVEKNLREAFRWYLMAAQGGLLAAQEKVSLFYSVGVGTVKNDERSYFWLLIAQYNGGQNLSSQVLRLEQALSPETRERVQDDAQQCVDSSYAECGH